MPKLTFLGCTYNNELYIADAIESLRDQTEKDIEIIYVNDGSDDGTKDILDYYAKKDPRIKPIHLDQNVGISKAWNIGLRSITGRVISVVSGDDVYFPKRAELSLLNITGPLDVYYGAYLRCDSQLRPFEGTLADGSDARQFIPEPYVKGCLDKKQTIPHGFMSLATELALKTPYREDLKVGIDYPFLKDLEKNGATFKSTKEVLGIYRFHNKMVSKTRRKEVDHATEVAGGNPELSYGM